MSPILRVSLQSPFLLRKAQNKIIWTRIKPKYLQTQRRGIESRKKCHGIPRERQRVVRHALYSLGLAKRGSVTGLQEMSKHRKDIYAEKLKLIPLSEEGGYFVETYRSPSTTTVSVSDREGKTRDVLTVIYFMISTDLGGTNYWNRNKSDINHFFHDGWPTKYTTISPEGVVEEFTMGRDVASGQLLQLTVRGGYFKAARVMSEEKQHARFSDEVPFTLISEAVAPGFDYRDRYVPTRRELKSMYPKLWSRIEDLARPEEKTA